MGAVAQGLGQAAQGFGQFGAGLSDPAGAIKQLQAAEAVQAKAKQDEANRQALLAGIEPSLQALPKQFQAGARAAIGGGETGLGQSFISAGQRFQTEQRARVAKETEQKRKKAENRKASNELVKVIQQAPGLDNDLKQLGIGITRSAGPKAGQQFLNSLASGALSRERAISLVQEKNRLRKEDQNVFGLLQEGIAAGELSAEASDEEVEGYLLGKGKKFTPEQAESIAEQARKQGFIQEGEGIFAGFFRKAKELVGLSKPTTPEPQPTATPSAQSRKPGDILFSKSENRRFRVQPDGSLEEIK